MNELRALFAHFCAEFIDQTHKLNACLPGKKPSNVLFHDAIGLGNLIFARVAVLRHDFSEIIDVVKIDVVKLSHTGVNIPRQAEIHEEQRAIRALLHGLLDDFTAQDRFFGGHGRNNDVRNGEGLLPLTPRQHFASVLFRQAIRAFARTVRHVQTRNSAVAQLRNHLLADGSSSQHQCTALVQLSENALGQLHTGGGHGRGPRAQFRF